MKYQIVRATNVSSLEQAVTDHLSKGCMLVGGVSVTFNQDNYDRWFYQAMTKNPPDTIDNHHPK